MICDTSTSSSPTSIQACLNASSLQQTCCGNSFLGLCLGLGLDLCLDVGQGFGRKAF